MFTWLKNLFTSEKPKMSDEIVQPAPATSEAPAAAAPTPEVDLKRLKVLLLAFGHRIGAEWDHLVAASTK